jgi:hypothetical protein
VLSAPCSITRSLVPAQATVPAPATKGPIARVSCFITKACARVISCNSVWTAWLSTTAYIKQPGPATIAAPPLERRRMGIPSRRQNAASTSFSTWDERPTTTIGCEDSQSRRNVPSTECCSAHSRMASSKATFAAGVASECSNCGILFGCRRDNRVRPSNRRTGLSVLHEIDGQDCPSYGMVAAARDGAAGLGYNSRLDDGCAPSFNLGILTKPFPRRPHPRPSPGSADRAGRGSSLEAVSSGHSHFAPKTPQNWDSPRRFC